jgi:hypothetical protein
VTDPVAEYSQISPTSMRGQESLDGAKTASLVYRILMVFRTLHLHFGTKKSESHSGVASGASRYPRS